MSDEVIIIGASAAGLSAAIYLRRRGVACRVLGKDVGGEMALSGEIWNYPGILKTNGVELSEKFKAQAAHYETPIDTPVYVSKLEHDGKVFHLTTQRGNQAQSYQAPVVIIATGARPKKLGIPGEDQFYQKGVTYCTVCDGPVFKGQPVAIIGGANSALEAGLMMAELSPQVFIVTKNQAMKGEQILRQELFKKSNVTLINNAQSKEIVGDQFMTGLTYEDIPTKTIKKLEVRAAFIHVGLIPNSAFIPAELGITNQFGEIVTDKLSATKLPGLFAAGDVTDIPFKQIGVAVGQGIAAALSAISYLNNQAR